MTEKPCKFYISGKKCKFGKNCKFLHPAADISDLNFDIRTGNDNGVLNSFSQTPNFLTTSKNPSFSYPQNYHGELKLNGEFDKLKSSQGPFCHFYIKNGYCNYSGNCKFYHPSTNDRLRHNQSEYDYYGYVSTELAGGHTNEQAREQDGQEKIEQSDRTGKASKQKEGIKKRLCQFYSDHGYCKFGNGCRFLHFYSKKKIGRKEKSLASESKESEEENREQLNKTEKEERKKPCPSFKAGNCRQEKNCQFLHATDIALSDKENESYTSISIQKVLDEKPKPVVKPNRQPFLPVKTIQKRSTTSEKELANLRKTELEQFKKRFPSDKLTVVIDNAEKFIGRFSFTPSDPDWPFDVRNFIIEIEFPAKYPYEMVQLRLPEDQDMPETVRKLVQDGIREWIKEKKGDLEKTDQLELIFRPFLRWMEKNLQGVVTNALRQFKKELVAKAAGFEFIPASQLQANVKQAEAAALDGEEGTASEENDEYLTEGSGSESDDKDNQFVEADVDKKGTEISFKNLQLKGQTGTLSIKKIHITIQCGRCRNKSDFSTPGNRLNSIDCIKCHETQLLRYRPTIAHQYSSVIGYLDLNNCIPFDLILQECHPIVSCMNCNKSSTISGFCSGQPNDINCRSCHEKLRVAVEAVKFFEMQQQVGSLDVKQVHKVGVKKQTRVAKDPAIQEGKPLPNNGTCKHYKKSYRWLRFPCCGKTYPCDICHNENESDHDMKYANRMICGFCCHEQVYSVEKPCKGCDGLMTKSSGKHWEGGQGCRDKIRMSRGDAQKYSNMHKTISKHSQKVKDMNSKKKTKLRHT